MLPASMLYDDPVLHPCSACGATNRFSRSRALENPKCGVCAQRIFPERAIEVADKKFIQHVEECPIPVLVDFRAGEIDPALDSIAAERAGRVKIVSVDLARSPILAAKYGVSSPTRVLFVDGRRVDLETAGSEFAVFRS